MKNIKLLSLLFTLLTLIACHHKAAETAAPLYTFDQTLTVKTSWVNSTGCGTDKNYVNLVPTINANQIFTASYKGEINSFNAQTGQRLWRTAIKEPVTAGVAADGNQLYVGTKKAEVIALN